MTKKRSTKRALLMSALSLLLCVSMLVGTTYAWFTDEVVSGMNTIQAGNLDVELMANGKEVKADTKLFSKVDKWEPGVVVYENLQVVNKGTLALKYHMSLNFGNENDLDGHKLSEVLKVAVIDKIETKDRATVLAAAKAATNVGSLYDFVVTGELEAGKVSTEQGVVIFWEPGENDNLYNANNGKTTSDGEALRIEFGVNLQATQKMSESDSFGTDYDAGASWMGETDLDWYFDDPDATEFIIDSPEELAGLAALVNNTATAPVTTYAATAPATVQDSFAGKTVKLGGNVDLNNLAWTPIGNWDNVFQGTFDGNGYTISNLYINDAKGEGIGLFGVVEKATIKGVKINNVNVTGYSMVAAVVGAPYPATISDCQVTGKVNIVADWAYVGGVAGYCYYGTQVENCAVIAAGTGLIKSNTRNAVGGITAWLLEGDHKVTNCQVKNLDLVGWTNVGGITGFVHYNNTISGCSVENVKLVKTRADGNPGIGLIAGGWSYSANNAITLSNNTVNGATLEGTHVAYSAYNELYGSEYVGATTANFVLDNNTTANITNNLVEVVKASTSAALKDAVSQKNQTVVLPAGTYQFPNLAEGTTIIGQDGVVFTNTLTGTLNNVTIKNVQIKASNAQRWAYSHGTLVFENCTFEATGVYAIHYDGLNGANITYKNCTIIGWAAIGGGAEHITFDGCKIFGNGTYGVIRLYSNGTIKNCTFDVSAVNTTDVYQDGIHAVDCEIEVSNNTNVNGTMAEIYNVSGTGKIVEK